MILINNNPMMRKIIIIVNILSKYLKKKKKLTILKKLYRYRHKSKRNKIVCYMKYNDNVTIINFVYAKNFN
jgi:hypothetical protein